MPRRSTFSLGICTPVATVESKLWVLALISCRSVLKLQRSEAFQARFQPMSVVCESRLAPRVSAPKLMPPSAGARIVPVSSAPLPSKVAPGSSVML